MASRTPQEVLEDRKVAVLLDDLLQTCIDSMDDARKIASGSTFKALGSSHKSTFNKCRDAVLTTSELTEKERDVCLDGKARDLNKLKACLNKQLDALDNLEEINGRMQVLEDAALETKLMVFFAAVGQFQGYLGQLDGLQRKFDAAAKKIGTAIKATRDAKIKGVLGAGLGAIGLCLVPVGGGIAFGGGIALAGLEFALGCALQGNEETSLKKAWNQASTAGAVADGLGAMPKTFAPAMIIVTGAVDLREAFKNEKELAALQKDIKGIMDDIKKLAPKISKFYKDFSKLAVTTAAAYNKAIAGVRSFKPSKGAYHKLPSLLK